MINTYNETDLHHTLKNLYTDEHAKQEHSLKGLVCDIYAKNNKIIEIQTGHFISLKKKLTTLLPDYTVEIIYPIITNAYIRMLNEDGTERSYRKSPKHGSFFQIFRELSAITDHLSSQNLYIRVLYIDAEIIKIDDKKGRSRYKNPRIINKRLLSLNKEELFCGIEDLITSIMKNIPHTFTSKDIQKMGTGKHTSYIISFLKKTKKITYHSKKERLYIYKKTDI